MRPILLIFSIFVVSSRNILVVSLNTASNYIGTDSTAQLGLGLG
jgi:hypothetical protein